MDFLAIQAFIITSHKRSFTAAAQQLNKDPSSISRMLSKLENEIGVQLLYRNTRQISLTDEGRRFLAQAEESFEQFKQSIAELQQPENKATGKLTITTWMSFGQSTLVPLLAQFQKLHPELELNIILSNENLDLIADGIDLAIRLVPEVKGSYICTKLFSATYKLCASQSYVANHPAIEQPHDILQHNLISFPEEVYRKPWVFEKIITGKELSQKKEVIEVSARGKLTVSDAMSVKQLMLNGVGLAFLANWIVDDAIAQKECIQLLPNYRVATPFSEQSSWILYPQRKRLPTNMRILVDYLKEHLKFQSSIKEY